MQNTTFRLLPKTLQETQPRLFSKKSVKLFLVLLTLLFCQVGQINAQAPTYQIYGPHTEYEGAYFIRVFINFVQTPNDKWTENVNLSERAAGIFENLNVAYNKHNIYFIGENSPCQPPFQVITQALYDLSHLHPYALDIFDLGDDDLPFGHSDYIPNTYCEVFGSDGFGSASQSEVLVHEVGHCFGLSHTHTGLNLGDCLETNSVCPVPFSCCYCVDYVCDTPISPQGITVSNDCNSSIRPSGLPPEAFRNYMSYATPGHCRDRFTEGQVKRMWAYLALAPTLENIQIAPLAYPANGPGSVTGNIVVESGELVINSPLEMLSGSTIRVKPGATLKVQSTITGACGQMWQGVIVEGDAFDSTQNPSNQGQVIVQTGGKIEHARCAIDVQDLGDPNGNTGGGIVKVLTNAQFPNNIIGIRFGQYNFENSSYLLAPIFSVTDDYRGGTERPTFVQLNGIKGLDIRLGRFWDLRTQCPDITSRAIGIDSRNSGFKVSLSSRFENLYVGIRTDKLTETNGSISVSGSNFIGCYKGIEVVSSGSFSITGNDFTVKKPDACPSLGVEVKGVEISGQTTGFAFSGNEFSHTGDLGTVVETLIATDCMKLGEGMANVIFKNDYSNLLIGNRASGDNGYGQDGLLYLCNTNENNDGLADFRITGSIRKVQGEITDIGPILPTGNTFTAEYTQYCTIENLGLEIEYYFYNGDPAQDPGVPNDPEFPCVLGFKREEIGHPNGSCDDPEPPCYPCSEPDVSAWKTSFHQNRQQWLAKTAALPYITNAEEREAEIEAVRRLRIAMNRDGSRVLMRYSLDTIDIKVDSLTHWLALIQTYPADLRLARHHFFTGDYTAFYNLWGQIPAKYDLDENAEDEFERLGEVYDTLRAHLSAGTSLGKLPQATLETLKTWASNCDEPGFLSGVVLWRNGIEQRPDCSESGSRPVSTSSASSGAKEALKIYPNPTNDMLYVEYPTTGQSGWLRIFNLQGGLQKEIALPVSHDKISIPVGDFNNGLYLIQWLCNGVSGYRKVIVAH